MKPETEDLLDLLIARSLRGLDDEELDRLDRLLLETEPADLERLEHQLEAAVALAGNASALDEKTSAGAKPPDALVARLEADADRFFGTRAEAVAEAPERPSSTVSSLSARRPGNPDRAAEAGPGRLEAAPGRRAPGPFGWTGWAVAALLLITVWIGRTGEPPGAPAIPTAPADARMALLGVEGTVQTPWGDSAWAEFAGVRGDVVWNDARQEGYLRLSNMPANNPAITQYQLWIVDPARDEEPVDGGVFDIPPGARDVVVPIRAKLAVRSPAAFAITREQPGGVVVSEGPLLVVASRG